MTARKTQTAAQQRTAAAIIAGVNGDTAPLEQIVDEVKAQAVESTAPATSTPKAKPAPVGKVLPATAHEFEWAPKSEADPRPHAVGVKFTYRLTEGTEGGWFASLKTTVGGKWVNVAGRCDTVEQARELCGWVENGAMWLTYAKWNAMPYATVVEQHSALTV